MDTGQASSAIAGYSGAELVRILERHPHVEPVLLDHRDDAAQTSPSAALDRPDACPCTPEAVQAEGLAVVFLATPPEVSMELAPPCSTPAPR